MKNFRNNNKDFRYAVWTIFNASMVYVGSLLLWLWWEQTWLLMMVGVPTLNAFTKYINKRVFWDLWVSSDNINV